MFKKLKMLKMRKFNYALILVYLLKRKSEQKDTIVIWFSEVFFRLIQTGKILFLWMIY